MSRIVVEPRRVEWGVTRCYWCALRPADGLLDGTPICFDDYALQVEEWIAAEYNAGRGDQALEEQLHAEEQPARLPQLRPVLVTVDVCAHCRRTQEMVQWLAGQGWPRDCRICRWSW